MPPVTYEPIATTTLGSTQATVTFSSIPGTYTDLVIVGSILTDNATGRTLNITFNSDTGSNYSNTHLGNDGNTVVSNINSNQTNIFASWYGANISSTTNPFLCTIHINNYSNTTTNKTTLIRSGATNHLSAFANLWRNTAAINTIALSVSTGNMAANTTFTVYGIKAA